MLVLLVEKLPEVIVEYMNNDANLFTCFHISSMFCGLSFGGDDWRNKGRENPKLYTGIEVLQCIDFAYFIAEEQKLKKKENLHIIDFAYCLFNSRNKKQKKKKVFGLFDTLVNANVLRN